MLLELYAATLLLFAFGGITVTRDKKVLDLGPIEAHKEEKHRLPLPAAFGGLALAGGVVLIAVGARSR